MSCWSTHCWSDRVVVAVVVRRRQTEDGKRAAGREAPVCQICVTDEPVDGEAVTLDPVLGRCGHVVEHRQPAVCARRHDRCIIRLGDRPGTRPQLAEEERVEVRILGRIRLQQLCRIDRVGRDELLDMLQHRLWIRLVVVHLALSDRDGLQQLLDRLVAQERLLLALVEQQMHAYTHVDRHALKDLCARLPSYRHIVAHVVGGEEPVQRRLHVARKEATPPVRVTLNRDRSWSDGVVVRGARLELVGGLVHRPGRYEVLEHQGERLVLSTLRCVLYRRHFKNSMAAGLLRCVEEIVAG